MEESMKHIQEVPPGGGFYAIAWCGKKLGMLDDYVSSVEDALKNQGEKLCPKCVDAIQRRLAVRV